MEPNGISGLLKTSGHGNNLRVGAIPTYAAATRRRYRVSSGSLPSEPARAKVTRMRERPGPDVQLSAVAEIVARLQAESRCW
jgi:hypothetical protein